MVDMASRLHEAGHLLLACALVLGYISKLALVSLRTIFQWSPIQSTLSSIAVLVRNRLLTEGPKVT